MVERMQRSMPWDHALIAASGTQARVECDWKTHLSDRIAVDDEECCAPVDAIHFTHHLAPARVYTVTLRG